MAIDVKNLEQQIRNLEIMRDAFEEAIDRAKKRLQRINHGEAVERVFEADQVPAGQSHPKP